MNLNTNVASLSPEADEETRSKGATPVIGSKRERSGNLLLAHLWRFVAGFSIVVIAVSLAWPYLPRRYEATTTIVLHPADLESTSDSIQLTRQPLDENAVQSEIDQIASPLLLQQVFAKLSLASDPEFIGSKGWFRHGPMSEADAEQRLGKRLTIAKDHHSYTVKFGFVASDPDKAAALTNALLKAYIANQLSRKREQVNNLTTWLKDRADLLQAKSDTSQKAVEAFLVDSGLIDAGAKISLERQLSTLANEEAIAKSRTLDTQARANALAELKSAGKLDGAPEVLSSTVIQRLKQTVSGGRSLLSPVDSGAQNGLDQQIALEADRIFRSVKTEAATSLAHELGLQQAIREIRDQISQREVSELHLAVLRHDAASDRTALDDALIHLAAQTARGKAVLPDIDIINPPTAPILPIFPNPLMVVLGTIIAGCLAGAAMVGRPLFRWMVRIPAKLG